MEPHNPTPHLSQIETLWSVVCQAHDGPEEAMRDARRRLLDRYGQSAYRYLLKCLREADLADEAFQEFALRFVRGDFHRADPERGRFRDFLKTSLFHLVADQRERHRKQAQPLSSGEGGPVVQPPSLEDMDRDFLDSWRDELLAKAWHLLEESDRRTGQWFFAVLRFRADHADMPSAEMAEALGAQLGRSLTSAAVRQTLHRARDRFADLLLDEVANSLAVTTPERLEEELIDLGLLEYCRPALERRRA